MSPIYFHGTNNRYKEHNKTNWLSATKHYVSSRVTITIYLFSQVINKSLHVMLIKVCTNRGDHCLCHHCWNTPLTTSLCSHSLFHLHVCSVSINEGCWVQFFSAWRNWVTYLSFIHTSMSDFVRLPHCYHLPQCNKLQREWLVGRFCLYNRSTNIDLWCCGTT